MATDPLPRVSEVREAGSGAWAADSSHVTHVVVPIESVVERECGECDGQGGWPQAVSETEGTWTICPKCGGSGKREAVFYEPDPVWLREQIVRVVREIVGSTAPHWALTEPGDYSFGDPGFTAAEVRREANRTIDAVVEDMPDAIMALLGLVKEES